MIANKKEALDMANRLYALCGSRDPFLLADYLDITVSKHPFTKQKGMYKLIARQPFIFLNDALSPALEKIVLCHEIGHDRLHRKEAAAIPAFSELNIFDTQNNRLEYEANLFAAEFLLSDEEVLELLQNGLTAEQIANTLDSVPDLICLKAEILASKGFPLRLKEYAKNLLR